MVLALNEPSDLKNRPIRSFVLRQGRLTCAQERALQQLWPQFGLEVSDSVVDLELLFARAAPVVLEIGFGNGDALARCALEDSARNYLGAEVHTPGVGHLLLTVEAQALTNVRVHRGDAVALLTSQISAASLSEIRVWFPDPWHKSRHNKRRLIQPDFVRLLASRLKPEGVLHLATDWQPYAEHMRSVLEASAAFENIAGAQNFAERPQWRPLTRFEQRGQRLGHGVWDLLYRRNA